MAINLVVYFTMKIYSIKNLKMGGCFSDHKNSQFNDKERTQPIKVPNNSVLRLSAPNNGNIFLRISNPVQNQKIIITFQSLTKTLQIPDSDSYPNCSWRKVSCPPLNTLRTTGICQWSSPQSKCLNGQSLLYHNDKNNEFLVGGVFTDGKLNKNEKCFKIFQNGAYYVGYLNSDYVPHGDGELWINDKDYFKGNFHQGVPHGDGQKCQNEKKFIGTFRRGQIIKGKEITVKGTYEGTFKNNQKHGKGLLRMNSGLCYEGEFENNKKEGNGTLSQNQKILYKGKWKDDKQLKNS